jgi:hypothetical protein
MYFVTVDFDKFPIMAVLEVLIGLGTTSFLGGTAYGRYVKDISQAQHEVKLKEGTLDGVLPVLIMSHHSIYKSGDTLIVLPASDIQRVSVKISKPLPSAK